MNIEYLRKIVDDGKSNLHSYRTFMKTNENKIKELEKIIENHIKARWLISEASRITQLNVKDRIESLVTYAIQGVFERDSKLVLDFEIKRNKSEVKVMIQNGDNEPYLPEDNDGGSILDVVSLALRVVLWSLQNPRTRPFFIFDEPGKWTGRLVVEFGKILREISSRLGIQVLMVTHDPELLEVADRAWKVEHNGVHSLVKQIDSKEDNDIVIKRRRKDENSN